MAIAEDARQPGFADQRGDKLGRKTRGLVREIAPIERNRGARHLPVAGRRILAARRLGGKAVYPLGSLGGDRAPDGIAVSGMQAKTLKFGQLQPGACCQNVAKGIGPLVPERDRIGRAP